MMRYTEADPMAERSYAQQLNDTSANNGEQQSQAIGIRQRYRTFYRAEDISFFLRNFFSESIINGSSFFSFYSFFGSASDERGDADDGAAGERSDHSCESHYHHGPAGR